MKLTTCYFILRRHILHTTFARNFVQRLERAPACNPRATCISTLSRCPRRATARPRQSRKHDPLLLILNLSVLFRIRGPDEHSDAVVLPRWLPSRLSVSDDASLNEVRGYAVEIEIAARVGRRSGLVASWQHAWYGEVFDYDYS